MKQPSLFTLQPPVVLPYFDGPKDEPEPARTVRLGEQLERILGLMQDGEWRTLETIALLTGDPTPSISAQLRHLRKKRFGSHTVERRHLSHGLYEYRVTR